ncbi:hypothetical protein AAG906_019001 [Vitis piasezkii]
MLTYFRGPLLATTTSWLCHFTCPSHSLLQTLHFTPQKCHQWLLLFHSFLLFFCSQDSDSQVEATGGLGSGAWWSQDWQRWEDMQIFENVVRDDPTNNVPDAIFLKLGMQLHRRDQHPIGILKNAIYDYFNANYSNKFDKLDDLCPIVSTKEASKNIFTTPTIIIILVISIDGDWFFIPKLFAPYLFGAQFFGKAGRKQISINFSLT